MSFNRSLLMWRSNLPYTDPIKRRLAPVLHIFLVSLIAILCVAIVLSLFITGLSIPVLVALVPAFIFGFALAGSLNLLHRGNFNWAIGLIIIALLVNQERSFLMSGFLRNQQTLLTSMWPLMLAAFLLSRRWLVLTALVNFISIAIVALHEQVLFTATQSTTTTTPLARLTGFALILILTCILLEAFTSIFRSELAASIQRERDLEAEIATRKRAEEELAQQREQYRVTLASIGDAVIATDTTGQVTFLNEVAEELIAWKEEEALGQPLANVFPIFNEETLLAVDNPLTRVLSEGIVVGLANHTVLAARDGARRPIADSGAPIRSSDGQILGAVMVFRDVSEERRAEAELKASEERFRLMADHAPVLIWMSDDDQMYTFLNQQWLEFTGRPIAQELGMGWTESIHPDDLDRCLVTYSQAFDKREPFSMEYRLRRHDSEYCWMIDTGTPHFLMDGRFAGYIGSCIDITARKQAEERARLLQMLTSALSSALTAEEVARVFIDKGFPLLGAQRGTIALLNNDHSLEIVGHYHMPDDLLKTYLGTDLDRTPLGQAIRTQTSIWIESYEKYEQLFPKLANRVSSPSEQQALVSMPLTVHNRTIGGISVRYERAQRWDDDRQAFMLALAGQCAQAMERALLHRQAQQVAALEERHRLAQDLHDAVTQTLFSSSIIAESLPTLWKRNPERGIEQVNQLVTLNRAVMTEMRSLLQELRPEILLKASMSMLFQQLAGAAKGRTSIEPKIQVEGSDEDLPPEVRIAFYRIAQESINNIVKHSQATEYSIYLHTEVGQAQLEIRDNGKGFDVEAAADGFGMGLDNIRDRAKDIDAILDIQSQIGVGTLVKTVWKPQNDSPMGA